MLTAHRERIEIDLPRDVLFAMEGLGEPDIIGRKVKVALALFLFQEGTISLGRALELADMHRVEFIELLEKHGTAAYDYTERDFEQDQEAVAAYRRAVEP